MLFLILPPPIYPCHIRHSDLTPLSPPLTHSHGALCDTPHPHLIIHYPTHNIKLTTHADRRNPQIPRRNAHPITTRRRDPTNHLHRRPTRRPLLLTLLRIQMGSRGHDRGNLPRVEARVEHQVEYHRTRWYVFFYFYLTISLHYPLTPIPPLHILTPLHSSPPPSTLTNTPPPPQASAQTGPDAAWNSQNANSPNIPT